MNSVRGASLAPRPASRSARLNILSMRSVMMNPPTTLIVAEVTATKPRTLASRPRLGAGQHERADERDGADGVGRRHERGVEQGRHPRDDRGSPTKPARTKT